MGQTLLKLCPLTLSLRETTQMVRPLKTHSLSYPGVYVRYRVEIAEIEDFHEALLLNWSYSFGILARSAQTHSQKEK